jgi:hypothetical protein
MSIVSSNVPFVVCNTLRCSATTKEKGNSVFTQTSTGLFAVQKTTQPPEPLSWEQVMQNTLESKESEFEWESMKNNYEAKFLLERRYSVHTGSARN